MVPAHPILPAPRADFAHRDRRNRSIAITETDHGDRSGATLGGSYLVGESSFRRECPDKQVLRAAVERQLPANAPPQAAEIAATWAESGRDVSHHAPGPSLKLK